MGSACRVLSSTGAWRQRSLVCMTGFGSDKLEGGSFIMKRKNMHKAVYRNLLAIGGLAAVAYGCGSGSDGSRSGAASAYTPLTTLSVPTVTTLGTCSASAEGEVVFLSSTGMGTLQTCNGTTWVASACAAANIDQVVYVASQATFEACTGTTWIALPFSATGVQVGTGPASIAGTVTGPSGAVAGATVTLTGSVSGTPPVAVTDNSGKYAFTGLNDGSYTVSVSAPNCST